MILYNLSSFQILEASGEKTGWHTSATPKNIDLNPEYTETELLIVENDKLGLTKSKDRVSADFSGEGKESCQVSYDIMSWYVISCDAM